MGLTRKADGVASKDQKAERKRLKDEYLRAQQAASAVRMPLDRAQLDALLYRVNAAVAVNGCDHTLAATDAWAVAEGIDLKRLHEGLEEYGGYCDCEVLMNVDADEVFTPVRTPRG